MLLMQSGSWSGKDHPVSCRMPACDADFTVTQPAAHHLLLVGSLIMVGCSQTVRAWAQATPSVTESHKLPKRPCCR